MNIDVEETMEHVNNRMEFIKITENDKSMKLSSKVHGKASKFCEGVRLMEIYQKRKRL